MVQPGPQWDLRDEHDCQTPLATISIAESLDIALHLLYICCTLLPPKFFHNLKAPGNGVFKKYC